MNAMALSRFGTSLNHVVHPDPAFVGNVSMLTLSRALDEKPFQIMPTGITEAERPPASGRRKPSATWRTAADRRAP